MSCVPLDDRQRIRHEAANVSIGPSHYAATAIKLILKAPARGRHSITSSLRVTYMRYYALKSDGLVRKWEAKA